MKIDKRKQPHTEEHRRKISEAQRALGKLHWSKRPEVIAQRLKTLKETWKNPELKKRHSEAMKKRSTPEFLRKLSLSHKGQHSSPATQFPKTGFIAYKLVGGINAYRNLHKWVEKQLGKPDKCSCCGKIATGKQMHWANKNGNYQRVLTDWIRLCAKCHYEHDLNRQIRVRDLLIN